MRKLTVKQILEFYDVPQLFIATDALNTNYLCLLYQKNDGYEYLAVQVSELRLSTFLHGDMDLRKAYMDPEQDNSLYHVTVKQEDITADRLLQPTDLTEQMLPDAGFYYEAEDAIPDSCIETLQIDIPAKDHSFFSDVAKRMGWNAKVLTDAARRIAVL